MAGLSKIPDALVLPLLDKQTHGARYPDLTKWLKEVHGVETSDAGVRRRLKEWKLIQLEAKRDAVRENAAEKALDYISIIDSDIAKLNKATNKIFASDNQEQLQLAKSLVETKLKLISKQMEITGMNKDDATDEEADSAMVAGLLSKLGKSN